MAGNRETCLYGYIYDAIFQAEKSQDTKNSLQERNWVTNFLEFYFCFQIPLEKPNISSSRFDKNFEDDEKWYTDPIKMYETSWSAKRKPKNDALCTIPYAEFRIVTHSPSLQVDTPTIL
ncbi:14600_t:CDS:2 [Funneliformis caledonium]|uniref:14600_t:CDS:1 n=1 Tax=Funneliformis caledonium TaxID=1117310 RepID=A0A9N9DCW8_9GLOM|nr:14600_t:CDS:2 [Funneliformis caledonium]